MMWIGLFSWFGLGPLLFVVDFYLLHRYGQTIGKRALGLRIVRSTGARASLGRIFWRRMVVPGLIMAIPLVGDLFALADTLAIFTSERRTLHDRIAGTIVVDLKRTAPVPPDEEARRP